MSEVVAAAPAQPEVTPAPLTPVHQAVVDNDYVAFETAERAAKSGKPAVAPVPAVEPAKPVAAAPVDEPRAVSKRQQEINDKIRQATEKATADLTAENARLRAQLPPPATPPVAAAPPVEKFPKYADWLEKNPDGDLESWIDARDDWRDQRRAEAARDRETRDQHAQAFRDESKTYSERMKAAIAAEPEFLAAVSSDLLALETPELEMARAAQESRPPRFTLDHDLAYLIRKSEAAPRLLRHLSDHAEALSDLRSARTREAFAQKFYRLEAKLLDSPAPVAEVPPVVPTKTHTDAPPPPTTLGTKPATPADPIKGAIASNDYSTYERLERERLAGARR